MFKDILIPSEDPPVYQLWFLVLFLLTSPTRSAGDHLYRRVGGNVFYPDPVGMETPVQCPGNSAQQQQIRG